MNLDLLQPWEKLMKQIVWQQKMIEMEMRVSDIDEYKILHFFTI